MKISLNTSSIQQTRAGGEWQMDLVLQMFKKLRSFDLKKNNTILSFESQAMSNSTLWISSHIQFYALNLKPHPYGDVNDNDDDDDDEGDDDDHDNDDDHDDDDDDDDHHLFTFGGLFCILKRLFHTLILTSAMHISWGTPIN